MKIKLTEEILEQGENDRGGWSRDQLILLGAGWAPLKGWKARMIGTEVEEEMVKLFLQLRNLRKKKDKKNALTPHIVSAMRCLKQNVRLTRKQQRREKLEQGRTNRQQVATPVARANQRKSFYDSDAWRALRYKVLKKLGAICGCCGAGRHNGKVVHVDHIKPRSLFPELELDETNLQVLCEDCNLGKSNTDSIDWRQQQSIH